MAKICTSIEQSKKLMELGIDINTADMIYYWFGNFELNDEWYELHLGTNKVSDKDIPAWSLAALISVLPLFIEFKGNKYYLRFMKDYVEYANDEISITGRCLHTTGNNNLIDAAFEMILKLHKLKMLL